MKFLRGGRQGTARPRASRAVYDAGPRRSFVVALKDVPELWEVSYDPKAAPTSRSAWCTTSSTSEGAFVPGFLNPRRTQLDDYLDDFFFTPDYREVMGTARDGEAGPGGAPRRAAQDRRRSSCRGCRTSGRASPGSSTAARVMATPNLREGVVSVIDMQAWKPVKQIRHARPGLLHAQPREHALRVGGLDDEPGAQGHAAGDRQAHARRWSPSLRPEPGKTLAHIEFTRDGRYALASLWELDGALIVYDAQTLEEVKRIPMQKPVGKYNVHNKITKSEGTSH